MKLIKINTIAKQAFSFIALYWLADTLLHLSPIGGIFNTDLVEGIANNPSNILTIFMMNTFALSRNSANAGSLINSALYGLLWGIFYERHEEDYSLTMASKVSVTMLFIYGMLLTPNALTVFSKYTFAVVSSIQTIGHAVWGFYLIPALIVKGALILSPLFIAIQSGRACFRKLYSDTAFTLNVK